MPASGQAKGAPPVKARLQLRSQRHVSLHLSRFDRPAPDLQCGTTGEFIGAWLEELDIAARELDLVPLSAFADSRPIPDGFDGDPSELQAIMGPCTDWYRPAEGAQALIAIADAIAADSPAFGPIDDRDAVEAELRDLASLLHRAAAEALRFRLELSY